MKNLLHTTIYSLLMICLVSLAGTSFATTREDDGARSILADGAGNRALALGGAYAAISDDASATIWNPAGLGWIQRRQLQASHTNLIGLGFSEQYASLVLPSWRWGVGAITFRNFGVDGIEERDYRNVLLNDNLTYSESEFTFAYGRQFSPAWALGASMKLRRLNLAGFSDSGLGLDLGLILKPALAAGNDKPWAENFTLGLSMRNAVEPSLRLDQEPVADPTGIRAGAAYKHPLGKNGWILGTMDVEKTREMNSHLHAGVEVCLVPALALRAGMNRGTFVAGMGVTWQDIGVDYMFENLPDNSIHRFGISFKFGRSRDEVLNSMQTAAELELQERLASKFRRQNEERKNNLLQRTRAALDLGNTTVAAELLAMLKVIDPENSETLALEIEILRLEAHDLAAVKDYAGAIVLLSHLLELAPDDAAAARMLAIIRASSDQQTARSQEIRLLLDQAMDDFAGGNLLAARKGFDGVLALDPKDSEALAMAKRSNLAIDGRISDLLDHARALGQAGQFTAANKKLEEARLLDPKATGLASASAWLTRQEAARKAATTQKPKQDVLSKSTPIPTVTAGPAPISEGQKREMAEMYSRGMAAMKNGAPDQAVHFWELAWSIDPEYQQVSEYLKQHYLSKGMEAFVAGQLQEAVRNWESAVRVAPDDSKAQGYLQRAQDQIKGLENISR